MKQAAPAAPQIEDFPSRADFAFVVPVAADRATAFRAITQWPQQGRWMLGTQVRVVSGDGQSVGTSMAGYTGVRPFGFLDSMTIIDRTDDLVVVRKTGSLVRGYGWMGALDDPAGARLVWGGAVRVPLGAFGALGWRLVARPLLGLGMTASLKRLARLIETGEMPVVEAAEGVAGAVA